MILVFARRVWHYVSAGITEVPVLLALSPRHSPGNGSHLVYSARLVDRFPIIIEARI